MSSWVNTKTIATAIVTGAILGIGTLVQDHLASAQDTKALAEQSARTAEKVAQTQIEIAGAVKQLVQIHADEDTKEKLMLTLCLSGQLSEPNDCASIKAEAGIE